MTAAILPKEPLVLNFKQESVTTVSRKAVRVMSEKLGFTETAVVHYALARLRDEMLDEAERDDLAPLTASQHTRIAAASPKKRGNLCFPTGSRGTVRRA